MNRRRLTWMLLAAIAAAAPSRAAAAAPRGEQAVDEGGRVLGRGIVGRTHPFYDSQTDDVRMIPLPQPRTSSPFNWNFRTIAYIMLGVLAAILLWVLWFFVRRMRRSLPTSSQVLAEASRRSDIDRIEALPFRVSTGPGDLLAQATELYRQGRFAEAIVLLFSYLLVEMDKQQVIRLAKGKTNRQYLREIGPRRPLRELVERTMTAFERVFFGHHPLDQAAFEACWSRVTEFQQLMAQENTSSRT